MQAPKYDVQFLRSEALRSSSSRTRQIKECYNKLLGLCFCWFPCQQGANGTVPDRWKATSWSYTCPMAEWQGTMLGRHGDLSVSRFVRSWCRSWGRFSGRACRCPQEGQIFQHWRPILIWTHCDRDFRRAQHVGSPAPFWPWQKDFPEFRRSQRGELSLSEMLSAGAAFQRSFTSQQFTGLWLHAVMVIPNTSFS